MYIPSPFRVEDKRLIREFLEEFPLGGLVTFSEGQLCANHIPFLIREDPDGGLILTGHVARANPVWRTLDSPEALVIFTGPGAYISPAWYPSREATGRVVPTWNYVAVHAHGPLRIFHEEEQLLAVVSELTRVHEAGIPNPWRVEEAPPEFIAGALRAIVGIEIVVQKVEAKWKTSQNRTAEDAKGAANALAALGDGGKWLAARMNDRGPKGPLVP